MPRWEAGFRVGTRDPSLSAGPSRVRAASFSVPLPWTTICALSTPKLAKSSGSTSCRLRPGHTHDLQDRKSTRLNSSHLVISYAVFCLKKKNGIAPLLLGVDIYVVVVGPVRRRLRLRCRVSR